MVLLEIYISKKIIYLQNILRYVVGRNMINTIPLNICPKCCSWNISSEYVVFRHFKHELIQTSVTGKRTIIQVQINS